MKKTLLFLLLTFSFISFSQVDYTGYILSKYVEFYEWNASSDQYLLTDEDYLDMMIDPYEDYYYVEIANDGDESKVWWEYSNEDFDFSGDAYYTEDDRKIVFNYDDQEIWFYYDYSERLERYRSVMVVSKLSVYDK